MAAIGLLVVAGGSVVALALLRGWVLSILWGWFVVPTFNLPQLSIPIAIGLALVVGFLAHQSIDVKSPERTGAEKWAHIAMFFVSPLLSLLFGYIVHAFL